MRSISQGFIEMEQAKAQRAHDVYEAQVALPHLLSGEATFIAMKRAVDSLVSRAPQDHDVFIMMDDFSVIEA
ncbi:MAG TPA: hypothetical protein VHX90_05030, partial [Verrucomicrobiae bacterium]|nr:hypothetical protein [Verrucomicrobiae bacterium]